MIPIQPVILCGGSGTRLWPLSRAGFPKQFLCLTGDESLFQLAAKRLMGLGTSDIQVANPYIVSGEDHRFLAAEQLRESGIELGAALLEPIGRNTAPALTLAALAAQQSGTDPILVVTPADQTVADQAVFHSGDHQALHDAMMLLKDNHELFEQYRKRCTEAAPNYDRSRLAGEMLAILEGVRRKPSRSHGQTSTS
jgi:mannose-1-phosphate guanylyltransferase/mannose-6-phosphate isomerase